MHALLCTCSAGFYIAAERKRNPSYSFRDYLSGLEKGIQDESEAMLISQNLSYPVTMTMAITLTLQGLLEDPNLNKVCVLCTDIECTFMHDELYMYMCTCYNHDVLGDLPSTCRLQYVM